MQHLVPPGGLEPPHMV